MTPRVGASEAHGFLAVLEDGAGRRVFAPFLDVLDVDAKGRGSGLGGVVAGVPRRGVTETGVSSGLRSR